MSCNEVNSLHKIMINQKCEKCKCEMDFSYVFANSKNSKLPCKKCKTELIATSKSKILFALILFIPIMLLQFVLPTHRILSLILSFLWIGNCLLLIQPIVYRYKSTNNVINTDSNKKLTATSKKKHAK